MVIAIAVLEIGSLFGALYATFVLWTRLFPAVGLEGALSHCLLVAACCLASFYYNDLYDLRAVRSLSDFVPRLLKSLAPVFVPLILWYSYWPWGRSSAGLSASMALAAIGLVLPLRAACYEFMQRQSFARRVLILGTGPLARKIAEEIHGAPHLGYAVVGFVEDTDPRVEEVRPRVPYASDMHRIGLVQNAIETLRPDVVIVAVNERRGRLPMWELLSSCAAGLVVEDGIEFYERTTRKLAIESVSPSFLIFSKTFKKPPLKLALRRLVSLSVAFVGLILTAPLMALIALLVRLNSSGPVFFVQERVGLGGRVFRLFKFRTMREGPRPEGGSVWRRDDACRITRLGRWMRKLRLDELPQFINILKGDMDLVGPRPEMKSNVHTMSEQIPFYTIRHMVRPGVTGWAQVRYGYAMSREEVEEKTRYDLYYIKHMSLALDLRILIDTVKIVFFGRGAR